MKKYKVVFYAPDLIEIKTEAETPSKATYKVFKEQKGLSLSKTCPFEVFIKYMLHYVSEVGD